MANPIYTTAVSPVAPPPANVSTGGLLTTPETYTPETNLTGQGYDATKWDVERPQTVAGQVEDIVAQGGPLQQQAEARSNMRMNSRGLLNSSMAINAGQSALYDAALPIAQADASVNANSANFNANASNVASQFRADAENKQNILNQDATNRAAEVNAGATNRLTEQSNTITAQANQANADAANKIGMQKLDNDFKTAISNADAASKAQLQSMADTTKIELAAIESTYKMMIDSNTQAASLYGKAMQNITDIVNNPDMLASDKTIAINNQKTMLKTGMQVVSEISGLSLQDILVF